jgi:hypothetical protein
VRRTIPNLPSCPPNIYDRFQYSSREVDLSQGCHALPTTAGTILWWHASKAQARANQGEKGDVHGRGTLLAGKPTNCERQGPPLILHDGRLFHDENVGGTSDRSVSDLSIRFRLSS